MEEKTRIDRDSDRWRRIKEIFAQALEFDPAERSTFLDAACQEDADLRAEIEKLLDSAELEDDFLESPAIADAPSIFDEKATRIVNGADRAGTEGDGFLAGTILASRYRILGLLGRGGMGEVYKADDIKLSQTVALKFLPDRLERDAAALERFHSEVRTARQVSHPNVCRVFDIGEIDGRHFLSMEFIDGDDLSSLLRRVGRLSSERAIEIARELCVGLAAIHNAGILHRDFKPANVIIDGKGKARITDFGIAGIEEEIANDRLRVGTPAYMSPEQIAGKTVSVRSDIYALGLVLYEIFTGKQAFVANSIHELIRKHQTETPTNPSEHVKGIDPLVESVIGQCLEKDPNGRPATALQVAMALPGGNPMQIALDAGEIPSPEMVAASPKIGALRPVLAAAIAVSVAAMLAFVIFSSQSFLPNNRIPLLKSGEVLSERVSEIARRLGYEDTPVERRKGFDVDYTFLRSVESELNAERMSMLAKGQPVFAYFAETQSPAFQNAAIAGNGQWVRESTYQPGQRKVIVDTRGRLIEFVAVPPPFAPVSVKTTDYSPAFQAAELDPARFHSVDPAWTPPVGSDERMAWEGVMPDHDQVTLRIEAASLNGKIVFFKLIYPWTPTDPLTNSGTTRNWIAILLFSTLIISVIAAAVVLAYRNVKSGDSDRRGAFRIAIGVMLFTFFGALLSIGHVPAFFPELDRLIQAFRESLQIAVIVWAMYLALEPSVRRNLPELIVSWNRLLSGDWRDPLVGRDVMIGAAWGVGHFALIGAGKFLENVFFGGNELVATSTPFKSAGLWPSMVISSVGENVWFGFVAVCGFAFIFLLLRRRLLASVVVFALVATIEVLFFTHSMIYLGFTLVISLLWTLVITRVGLVATIVSSIVFAWMESTLFTSNFSAFYSGEMLMTCGLIVALLVFGYRTSTFSSSPPVRQR